MEQLDYSREAHSETADNIRIMLGRVGLVGEYSDQYLEFCFAELSQPSEKALEASNMLRIMHVRSLGNQRGQQQYRPLEQIILGLVFGRTPHDPPMAMKHAIESYATHSFDSELIKKDCLRAFVSGVENMRGRVESSSNPLSNPRTGTRPTKGGKSNIN
jgi:hypothetical protein